MQLKIQMTRTTVYLVFNGKKKILITTRTLTLRMRIVLTLNKPNNNWEENTTKSDKNESNLEAPWQKMADIIVSTNIGDSKQGE